MKIAGYVKKLFVIALLLSLLLPLGFVFFAIEKKAVVTHVQTPDTEDAIRTQRFIKNIIDKLSKRSNQGLLISATEADISGLFAFGHRSLSRVKGRVDISAERFEIVATVTLPRNPIGPYLNFRLEIPPSRSGITIARAKIGRLSFPDSVIRFLSGRMLQFVIGTEEGAQLLNAIDSVTLNNKKIDIQVKPIPNLPQLIEKARTRMRAVRDEMALLGDPVIIRSYYAKIMALSQSAPKGGVSLSFYIGPLFTHAQARGGDPVIENRAAILALGIYFGSWRVEQMIGPVRTKRMKAHRRKTKGVGLANREDLRLHFLISSALQIAADQGITNVIGEFKELLDAGKGGSGFSFVDLAADRAGVRFAQTATHKTTALRFQTQLADHAAENQFFPDIKGLAEGLSQKAFERNFGNLESEAYRALVASVDHCIQQLPVHSPNKDKAVTQSCKPEGSPGRVGIESGF